MFSLLLVFFLQNGAHFTKSDRVCKFMSTYKLAQKKKEKADAQCPSPKSKAAPSYFSTYSRHQGGLSINLPLSSAISVMRTRHRVLAFS